MSVALLEREAMITGYSLEPINSCDNERNQAPESDASSLCYYCATVKDLARHDIQALMGTAGS